MGGLSKKVFQIKSLSTGSPDNILLLDSGNLLFKRGRIGHGPNQDRLTAKAIIQAYKDIGYDAVGVGPLDLAGGIDLLLKSQAQGFPWVSANITDSRGNPFFRQWVQRSFGGKEVAITSVMPSPVMQTPGITVVPWKERLGNLIPAMRKKNDTAMIIVLSSLSSKENDLLAQSFPEVSLIIASDSKKGNISPTKVNKSLLCQTARQGKYQGLLSIEFGQNNSWGEDSAKELAALQNRLGSLNWQLKRIENKKPGTKNDEKLKATVKRLNREKKVMLGKISALKADIDDENRNGRVTNSFSYRFIGLESRLPNDIETEAKLENLGRAIRKLNKEARDMARKKKASNRKSADHNITGFKVCATCHAEQAFFWENTQHATAYQTLVNKNKNLDLDCLPCHVTLDLRNRDFSQISKESLLSFPPELVSVGCETCHGTGKKHSINQQTFKMVKIPGQKICLKCHTPDHDDAFNYDEKIMAISCPAS